MEAIHIQHLFRRAGFGLGPQELKRFVGKRKEDIVDFLLEDAMREQSKLVILNEDIPVPNSSMRLPRYESFRAEKDKRGVLANAWLDLMVAGKGVLREKMALFWHHHLPMGGQSFELTKCYLELLREHALGSFRDLIHAVAKTPAMMRYLDNHHSHKDAPNENFPRELLELFTLGVGHYTLQDVKEAARAFTGWRYNHDTNVFYFDRSAHDEGIKTFLGRSGRFTGEDIIDIVLAQQQCARHLVRAIYRFFVDQKEDEDIIEYLTDVYYESDYNTAQLLREIFLSDWFYGNVHINSLVKTPVELLVGFQRQTTVKLIGIKTHDQLLWKMGQRLFAPPNVGGWPSGNQWINTQTVLYRTCFPIITFAVANRTVPRKSLYYKLHSRIAHSELRSFRYFMDAVYDRDSMFEQLSELPCSWSVFFWNMDIEGPEEVHEEGILYYTTSPYYQLN